ncbi:DUF6933 domain-containing protein [Halobacillus seohaensis]|uniref:DUF6933 domain-containing protein n=1 Tax=Halobacillus seohaensis TaxID=447421 RepID=A0ABW2EJK1_9BACI
MFVIGATEKLSKELNKELEDPEKYNEIPDINKWHANLITINRRKCLIIINNATGINLTLFGLRKQQFDNIENVIKGSLKQLLQLIKVEDDIIKQLLDATDSFVYTETANSQILDMMDQVKLLVEDSTEGLKYEEIDAAEINYISNAELMYNLINNRPIESLREYFNH